MKIKQSRKEFITLYQSLGNLGALRGMKFGFTIAKNREIIKPLIDKMNKLSKTPEKFADYEKERTELAEKFAKRDKDNNIVFIRSPRGTETYDIEDKEGFEKALEPIKEKHKEVIKERDDQVKELTDFFNEEVELDLRPLTLDVIPQDISVGQMEILSVLIAD